MILQTLNRTLRKRTVKESQCPLPFSRNNFSNSFCLWLRSTECTCNSKKPFVNRHTLTSRETILEWYGLLALISFKRVV